MYSEFSILAMIFRLWSFSSLSVESIYKLGYLFPFAPNSRNGFIFKMLKIFSGFDWWGFDDWTTFGKFTHDSERIWLKFWGGKDDCTRGNGEESMFWRVKFIRMDQKFIVLSWDSRIHRILDSFQLMSLISSLNVEVLQSSLSFINTLLLFSLFKISFSSSILWEALSDSFNAIFSWTLFKSSSCSWRLKSWFCKTVSKFSLGEISPRAVHCLREHLYRALSQTSVFVLYHLIPLLSIINSLPQYLVMLIFWVIQN